MKRLLPMIACFFFTWRIVSNPEIDLD